MPRETTGDAKREPCMEQPPPVARARQSAPLCSAFVPSKLPPRAGPQTCGEQPGCTVGAVRANVADAVVASRRALRARSRRLTHLVRSNRSRAGFEMGDRKGRPYTGLVADIA